MDAEKPVIDEAPPVLGSWPRVYGFIIGWLITIITLFALFTRAFAP